ncbi:helix-turn-helix domain-containing protein [Chryseobacterium sp. G0240]|uniref:helix-turn-helix transcriptional regulator n=1 Tax=Chryseobacterium sp. G0240 TaxID=2487066 RepID=UPI000F4554EA|nr:helix-turn-helix domain-containing protein [Chryseobacterium sp. G0240]ROI02529.1 helix-turn-helix domain-containing protein [Chryseobacterium sp. G0240]
MNLYFISFLDHLVLQNITLFCDLDFIKLAVFKTDSDLVHRLLRKITDFYIRFFQQIQLLPGGILVEDYCGCYNFTAWQEIADRTLREVFKYIHRQQSVNEYEPIPVYARYSDQKSIYMVCGLCWFENDGRELRLNLVRSEIRKIWVSMSPDSLSYLREMIRRYNTDGINNLSKFVNSAGYNYRQFQQDSRTYFGDSFYRVLLKLRMVHAANDIVFSKLSLKEIAFKNEFSDYNAMYKTFKRYRILVTEIPRIAC